MSPLFRCHFDLTDSATVPFCGTSLQTPGETSQRPGAWLNASRLLGFYQFAASPSPGLPPEIPAALANLRLQPARLQSPDLHCLLVFGLLFDFRHPWSSTDRESQSAALIICVIHTTPCFRISASTGHLTWVSVQGSNRGRLTRSRLVSG